MKQLMMDEFLRSLKQNIDTHHSLLLGAGAISVLTSNKRIALKLEELLPLCEKLK